MRLGIISDIHANDVALRAVLDAIGDHDIDRLLCAGDLVGYNTAPNTVIELLQDHDAVCVQGNHDAAVGDQGLAVRFNPAARDAIEWTREELTTVHQEFLAGLPLRFHDEAADLEMVHGSPINPLEEYVGPDKLSSAFLQHQFDDPPRILVTGHTHVPHAETIEDTLCVNPGSVGQPRDGDPRASYAIIETDGPDVEHHRVEYDIEQVVGQTREVMGDRTAERLRHGR